MQYITDTLAGRLAEFYNGTRKLTILTGAGLSADSGIPTFRDKDGFWTVGSKNYMPEEMGTYRMFLEQPLEVWKWFLYRFTICSKAKPNIGHFAIKELEELFGDRFRLISQNVDGLHFKAGSSRERTFLIHGTLEHARCAQPCTKDLYPYPQIELQKGELLSLAQIEQLKCPKCGKPLRPHVLWFDEYYNEHYYRFDSSLRVAKETGLLLVVGTSGATTGPKWVVENTLARGGIVIDINKKENFFSEMLNSKKNGYALQGGSSEILPEFVALFRDLAKKPNVR